MSGVYEGLTVVELADRRNQWAGKLLSDGGARVIQIEPIKGSPGRHCGPFVKDEADPDNCPSAMPGTGRPRLSSNMLAVNTSPSGPPSAGVSCVLM